VGRPAQWSGGRLSGARSLPPSLGAVKDVFRRGLIVVFVAVAVGIFVRLRGRGGSPLRQGGWRELEGPEFR